MFSFISHQSIVPLMWFSESTLTWRRRFELHLLDLLPSDTMKSMGKAGRALKQVLQLHNISQNQLAVILGIDRATVYKWFHEKREPNSETIVEITRALKQLKFEAAENFVQFYLGDILKEETPSEE